MRNIKNDAKRILAEVSMEMNDGDMVQSFNDIKEIDDLLGVVKLKSLINHSKGRRPNTEKRFDEVIKARLLLGASDRHNLQRRTQL